MAGKPRTYTKDVLLYLAQHPGQWVTREQVLRVLNITSQQFSQAVYCLRVHDGVSSIVDDGEQRWALATGEVDW